MDRVMKLQLILRRYTPDVQRIVLFCNDSNTDRHVGTMKKQSSRDLDLSSSLAAGYPPFYSIFTKSVFLAPLLIALFAQSIEVFVFLLKYLFCLLYVYFKIHIRRS
uniref:Uncharacterized protein n=1 Tax=Anguilla anguilla TaxID=7936 RepID=A0A0E9XEC7_ANGAN